MKKEIVKWAVAALLAVAGLAFGVGLALINAIYWGAFLPRQLWKGVTIMGGVVGLILAVGLALWWTRRDEGHQSKPSG